MSSDSLVEETANMLTEFLSDCVDKGMQPPFVMCAINRKGWVFAVRFNNGVAEVLSENNISDMIELPISGLVIDQGSQALKFVLNEDGLGHEPAARSDN